MGGRQSDAGIVLKKPLITVEKRPAHNNALSEDTFTVLRDGRINGNEIRKNSRQIVSRKEAGIHLTLSPAE